MTVKNITEAWAKADEIIPTDYNKNESKSARAGYDIYEGINGDYICDLGNRLEVNLATGKTVNIWIDTTPQFSEGQIEDALRVISEAIYKIDDNINDKLQRVTGIDKARKKIYGAYKEIAKILKNQHPESPLYKMYNLDEA